MNIENFTDRILRKMPKDLSQAETARYLYLKLGQLFCFDNEFWLGNTKTQKKIYYKAIEEDIEFNDENRKTPAICVSMSKTYSKLLNKVGIEAIEFREDDSDPHTNTVFEINGKRYKADLQRDLEYIQTHRRTKYFGENSIEGMKAVNTDEIDKKLGYEYYGDDYFYKNVELLKNEFKKINNLEEKMVKIFKIISEAPQVKELAYVERKNYYKAFLKSVLDEKDYRKIIGFDLKHKNSQEHISGYSVMNKNNNYDRFMYSEKKNMYVEVSDDMIIEAMNRGFYVVRNKKIPKIKNVQQDSQEM